MNRRKAVKTIAGGLIALSAGCTGSSGRPSKRELPDRPSRLDAQSAVEFAIEYEEANGFNERIEGRENLISFSYRCEGALERETENAYYVVTRCSFSETSEHDGERSAGEGYTDPISYYLSADDIVRAPTTGVRAETKSDSDATNGIRLVNLSSDDRSIVLDVAYTGRTGESEPEQWYTNTFDLSAMEGYTIERLTGPKGVYTVSVIPDNGTTRTYTWTVPGQQGPDIAQGWSNTNVNLGVFIAPTDVIRIFNLAS